MYAFYMCREGQKEHHSYIYVCIYICICCEVISGAKFGLLKGYLWGQLCFFITPFVTKHYTNSGFNPFFVENKKLRTQMFKGYLRGQIGIFMLHQTWPLR